MVADLVVVRQLREVLLQRFRVGQRDLRFDAKIIKNKYYTSEALNRASSETEERE